MAIAPTIRAGTQSTTTDEHVERQTVVRQIRLRAWGGAAALVVGYLAFELLVVASLPPEGRLPARIGVLAAAVVVDAWFSVRIVTTAVLRSFEASRRAAHLEEAAALLEREQVAHAEAVAAQQAAEAAVRARDEFLTAAAHELKTPVTSIKGGAQLMERLFDRTDVDRERLMRAVSAIGLGADRLALLTEDLLDVARLQSERLDLRPRKVDLAALVLDAIALTRAHTVATGVSPPSIEFESAGEHCSVWGDRDRLAQVVANLVSNALKYSVERGAIRVYLARPEPSVVELVVADHGIGLPAGGEEAIFRPFGWTPNAAAQHIAGLGLGLYLTRQIVEAHSGRIWAESDGEGRGTTFHVRLPAAGGVRAPATR